MPNRSTCEAVVRQLWPYLDGVVDDSDRESVIAHLEACATCRSNFEFARAFLRAVARSRPDVAPDERLERRVLAALGAEGFSLGA